LLGLVQSARGRVGVNHDLLVVLPLRRLLPGAEPAKHTKKGSESFEVKNVQKKGNKPEWELDLIGASKYRQVV
jgi:hypothetical protein